MLGELIKHKVEECTEGEKFKKLLLKYIFMVMLFIRDRFFKPWYMSKADMNRDPNNRIFGDAYFKKTDLNQHADMQVEDSRNSSSLPF